MAGTDATIRRAKYFPVVSRAMGVGLGLAWLAAAAFVTVTVDHTRTPDLWPVAREAARVGAVVLLADAAAFAWTRRRAAAAAVTVAAVAWQGWLLSGSGTAQPELRSAGLYVSALALPALGVLAGPPRRQWLWAVPATAGVVWAATYDPFHDVGCPGFCASNVYLVWRDPDATTWISGLQHVLLVTLAAVCAYVAVRGASAIRAALGAALSLAALADWQRARGHAASVTFVGSIAVLVLAALALSPLHAAAGRARRLYRLRRLTTAAAAGRAGSLQDGLREAVGDPALTVAYPCTDGTLVGADGAHHARSPGQVVTTLAVGGRTVAVIGHGPAIDAADLRAAFGASARMAAWNEGLAADLRRQLVEVTASRRRLLDAGDAERRRVERDLHDGVQQGLLALLFDLRRAQRGADGDQLAALERGSALVGQALAEVRDLARGVFPAVVDQAGMAAILHTSAEQGTRPVTIDAIDDRVPPAVAHAVHDLVAATASAVTSQSAAVVARIADDTLQVCVDAPGGPIPVALQDRITTLGGSWRATGDVWEVSLPCGS